MDKSTQAGIKKQRGLLAPGEFGPDYYPATFRIKFESSHRQKIDDLRKSLRYRIGTKSYTQYEQRSYDILMNNRQDQFMRWTICSEAMDYAEDLNEMGRYLMIYGK